MRNTCLITGGAGFIGSHLVDSLVAAGQRVRVLDDFSTGQRANLAHHGAAVEVIDGSITDPTTVASAVADVDVVFHLAAMASVARSLDDPMLCHAICATGTLAVLDAARRAGVRRAVYTGSSSAYGPAADPAGLDEDTPLRPLSPYAAAKLAGEHACEAFTASYGFETVRVRFFNIFGPRQRADSPYSGVIAIFASLLAAGRTPTVHGDGLQVRDFVHVSDAVQALRLASEVPGVAGRVFNIGTGRGTSVLDLIAVLNRVLGTSIVPAHGPAREGDVRFSLAKIERARTELGFNPRVAFEDGLRETIDWCRSAS